VYVIPIYVANLTRMAETPLQKGTGASEVKTSQPHWPQPFYTKGLGAIE